MKQIDIILPAYNEEQGLETFNDALFAVLRSVEERYQFRILYVLDRCTDNSVAVLRRLASRHPNITVLHLSRRFGHQMSLVAGIDHSRGDAAVMMDCDLQHPPEVIPLLLRELENGFDVVQAVRRYDGKTSVTKRVTSDLFYRVQNCVSPIEITPGSADFRLISRKVITVFQTSIREQNQFLRGLFQWVGFKQCTVEFVSARRAVGATKYALFGLLTFSVTGITSFSKLPLRFASIIGLLISGISMLYGLWMLGKFFWQGHVPPGYTSIVVMILCLGGLQLTVLGIIGEYMGCVFDEVKNRPLYVVDEVIGAEIGARHVLP